MMVMTVLYSMLDAILPFEWAGYGFMKNAFIAVLMICPLLGLLGTMVVSNRMAFFSDSLGHSSLTGIALGVLLGISDPVWSMLVFSIIFSIFVILIRRYTQASTDTTIGVLASTAVAAGVVVLSRGGGFNKYTSYLIGDILSVSGADLLMLLVVSVSVLIIWFFLFNRLFVVGINRSVALSRGMKPNLTELVFTLVIAAVVVISIKWTGLLIISSLLVLPAAASRNISRNTRQYHSFSIIISLFSGVGGLILSYYWDTATGATIVLAASLVYFATLFARHRSG